MTKYVIYSTSPSLIDTCVRNGYFAEALSLASHTNSLYSSSNSPPLILTSIISEVRNSITQMLFSLLSTLHEPNRKLPALWKAVNFLRKMDVFDPEDGVESEEQIALAFLGGREVCLTASLEGCNRDIQRLVGLTSAEVREKDKEDLTRYLKKYIDIWREGVHDIITQFRQFFSNGQRPPRLLQLRHYIPYWSLTRLILSINICSPSSESPYLVYPYLPYPPY